MPDPSRSPRRRPYTAIALIAVSACLTLMAPVYTIATIVFGAEVLAVVMFPRAALACSPLFILSSDSEGLSLAMLEAMGSGTVPIVILKLILWRKNAGASDARA